MTRGLNERGTLTASSFVLTAKQHEDAFVVLNARCFTLQNNNVIA